ncbi:hypothetical protein KEC58_15875 [Photobacterium damselae]|uniref:hypothetical protein n=1 Tax=Photobacterium damselae TaxID=38293 RepID=UPI0025431A3D
MNQDEELKRLSNSEALLQYSSDQLLEAFIHSYNEQNIVWDELVAHNSKLEQQIEGYKRQCISHQADVDYLNQENETLCKIAKGAEELTHRAVGQKQELDLAKAQIKQLQQTIKELKKDNPDKMKQRIQRQVEKAVESKNKIARLEKEAKKYRKDLQEKGAQLQGAFARISELKTELLHNTGSGLYHNGDHNLIIWPQETTMEDENGDRFSGRSLLYLHKSGRGGLINYNPMTEQVNLCAAPKGGLRPSDEVREFATNWLFKVNVTQGGVVNEEDMIPVNYNGCNYAETDC